MLIPLFDVVVFIDETEFLSLLLVRRFLARKRGFGDGSRLCLCHGQMAWQHHGLRAGGEALPGYAFHNISATVHNEAWQVTAYIDNVTDKFAETSVRQTASFIREVGGFDLRRYFKIVILYW